MHSTSGEVRRADIPQEIFDVANGQIVRATLPPPQHHVLRGIKWGHVGCPFTPAFWATQVWLERNLDLAMEFRWGCTLVEEVVGCLLGGYGITWEMNHAAFCRLSEERVLSKGSPTATEIIELLSRPFISHRQSRRYRFPRQKGMFVAEAINRIAVEQAPTSPPALRDWLIGFRGIGPKTASWITRNFLNCQRIAVIDVHLYRACVIMGLFSGDENVVRDYIVLEERFLDLADAFKVDPRRLDAVIWKTMRNARGFAIRMMPIAA